MTAHVVTVEEFQTLADRVSALEAQLADRPDEEPQWLTLRDAAHHIGRTEDATYKLVTRLGLKHQQVPGGRIQIRRVELDAALNSNGRRTR